MDMIAAVIHEVGGLLVFAAVGTLVEVAVALLIVGAAELTARAAR